MKFLIFILPAFFCGQMGLAQELVSAAGAYYSTSDYNVHWSMGEVVTDTYDGTAYGVSKGFHQGSNLIITNTEESSRISIDIFPNPAHEYIHFKGFESIQTHGIISNHYGQIVRVIVIENSTIDVSDLTPGFYYIVLKNDIFKYTPIKFVKL